MSLDFKDRYQIKGTDMKIIRGMLMDYDFFSSEKLLGLRNYPMELNGCDLHTILYTTACPKKVLPFDKESNSSIFYCLKVCRI